MSQQAGAGSFEMVDPADPRALEAVATYLAELDDTFEGGFSPAPDDLDRLRPPTGAFLLALDEELQVAFKYRGLRQR